MRLCDTFCLSTVVFQIIFCVRRAMLPPRNIRNHHHSRAGSASWCTSCRMRQSSSYCACSSSQHRFYERCFRHPAHSRQDVVNNVPSAFLPIRRHMTIFDKLKQALMEIPDFVCVWLIALAENLIRNKGRPIFAINSLIKIIFTGSMILLLNFSTSYGSNFSP